MTPLIIAIDGPAGSGKSTLARGLAIEFGLPYLNTGLMYRAITRLALERGVDPGDGRRLADLVGGISFSVAEEGNPPSLHIDGMPPLEDLMSDEVEAAVSGVSRHGPVRERLREEQRRLGAKGAVVEGRDIGSVVFPDASVKIFLKAGEEERASRRVQERQSAGVRDSGEDIAESLRSRDEQDSRVNPFVPAPDAVVLDTTGRDQTQVFDEAAEAVRNRLPK
ncbi:MAG: (d)CMP kinase [Actinomycetota bacterium]